MYIKIYIHILEDPATPFVGKTSDVVPMGRNLVVYGEQPHYFFLICVTEEDFVPCPKHLILNSGFWPSVDEPKGHEILRICHQ